MNYWNGLNWKLNWTDERTELNLMSWTELEELSWMNRTELRWTGMSE